MLIISCLTLNSTPNTWNEIHEISGAISLLNLRYNHHVIKLIDLSAMASIKYLGQHFFKHFHTIYYYKLDNSKLKQTP